MKIFDQNIWGNFGATQKIGNRNHLIAEMIFEEQPDLCCFQECNPRTSRVGETALPLLLQPRYLEACPECAHQNFTPIFYNRDTLSLIDADFLPFPGRNDANSKSFTWAVLEEKKTGKRFAAVSTHFWYKNVEIDDEMQRVENAQLVAGQCRALDEAYHIPVFAMGDLNNGVHSPFGGLAIKEMENQGFRDVRALAKETSREKTCHDYPILSQDDVYLPSGMPTVTIDYIYMYQNPPVALQRFFVRTDDKSRAASDHCPLILEFDLL